MLDFGSLSAIAVAFFVATASPGPATLAVAAVSMNSGRKTGLLFGLGLSVGLAFWGLIAATGLGALLQASTYALAMLKVFGGAYLLWLAYKAAQSAATSVENPTGFETRQHGFQRGLLLNISNPKAVFAWMAVLSLGLGDGRSAALVAVATGVCMALGGLIYAIYALIFSTPGAMSVYRRTRRWIDGVVAGLFALAGVSLLRSVFVKH